MCDKIWEDICARMDDVPLECSAYALKKADGTGIFTIKFKRSVNRDKAAFYLGGPVYEKRKGSRITTISVKGYSKEIGSNDNISKIINFSFF